MTDSASSPQISEGKLPKAVLVAEFAATGGALEYASFITKELTHYFNDVYVMCLGPSDSLRRKIGFSTGIHYLDPPKLTQEGSILRRLLGRNPVFYWVEAILIRRSIRSNAGSVNRIISSVCSPGRFLGINPRGYRNHYILHTYPRGTKHRVAGAIFGLTARATAKVISVSGFVAHQIATYWPYLPARQNIVLANTAGPVFAQEAVKSPIQILCVGTLTYEKNPELFVKVAHEVVLALPTHHVTFVWLGDGPQRELVQNMVNERGLQHSVSFKGYVPDPSSAYESATIYFQSSRVDSMPLATLEALRRGIPTVVTNVGGLPEILGEENARWVCTSDDSQQCARTILELVSHPDLRDAYSSQLTKRYAETYSPEKWRARFIEVLEL